MGFLRYKQLPGGTTATRFSFAGTRFRFPTVSRQVSGGNTFSCAQFVFGSPDYAITNPRFFMPAFISPTSPPEIINPNTIQVEGLSIKIGSSWYAAPSANLPANIDPTTQSGVLLDPINVTIPANTLITARVAYNTPAAGFLPSTVVNTTGAIEGVQGSTSSLAAKLTDNSSISNVNGTFYMPAFMVAQGGDGRPAFIVVGDSIGYGENQNPIISQWSARNESGYIFLGLDDNSTSKRLAYANFCIPGNAPFGSTGWSNTANWSGKLASVALVNSSCGALPFDYILSQHGTNDVSGTTNQTAFRVGMISYYGVLAAQWPAKPIIQVELIPKPASNDGYQTLNGQVAAIAPSSAYPSGNLWTFNADVGTNGVSDPTTYYRSGGYISDSFAPWLQTSYDTGSNRAYLKIRPFNTTFASDYISGTSCSLNAAPALGECLDFLNVSATVFTAIVTSVLGSGPYTVGFVALSTTSGITAASGVIQACAHDGGGLHPSSIVHQTIYPASVINWKIARGWV